MFSQTWVLKRSLISVIIIDIEAADRLQHDQQVASGDEFHD